LHELRTTGLPADLEAARVVVGDLVATDEDVVPGAAHADLAVGEHPVVDHPHAVPGADTKPVVQPDNVALHPPAAAGVALDRAALRGVRVLLDGQATDRDVRGATAERVPADARLDRAPRGVVYEVDLVGAIVEVPLAGTHLAAAGHLPQRLTVHEELVRMAAHLIARAVIQLATAAMHHGLLCLSAGDPVAPLAA